MNSETLNLDMNTENVSMELSFVSAQLKPKSILVLGDMSSNDMISLLLNADNSSLITVVGGGDYEEAKSAFEKYDIVPRLSFYSGEVEEIVPWIEEKFDLVVVAKNLDLEMIKSNISTDGHLCIEAGVGEFKTSSMTQVEIENVKSYKVYKI